MTWDKSLFWGVLLSGVLMPPALAQDAGSLLREQQRQQELRRLERPPDMGEDQQRQPPTHPPERGEVILVKDLRFVGRVELLSASERERLTASATGKRLGIRGPYALADEVTAQLQAQGRLLARAILPPQDVTEGIITIKIVEGTLEKMEFERRDGVRVRETLLRDIGQRHIRADAVTKQDLEAALLRMNDLPGVSARARLAPGQAPNTSSLIVGVEQEPVFSASVWGDNFGSSSTGRARANAQATMTDVTGYGDLTSLSGNLSDGEQFGSFSASAPLCACGLTANATYSYLHYRNIDDVGKALELDGYAHFLSGGLDYSLMRSRDANVLIGVALNWKALVDDSLAGHLQDKRSLSGTLTLSGDMRDVVFGGGLTSWSLGWTYGDLDLSREPSALAADQAGLQTQGNFHRLNVSLARLQDLPRDFSLFGRVYGQWADRNLDSSEDFALGGPYGVRGYPVSEGQGDLGLLGTFELRYDAPVPAEFGNLQLAGFLDAGHVWVNKNQNGIPQLNACGCNDYGLAGAGLSARWTRENLNFAVSWAHTLGSNPGRDAATGDNADGHSNNNQFWLTSAIRF
ncbi:MULTISPECIES: ShlB/FhaC/HecB family hemolysin secretion/activation protein [unclassified Mesorhizobium]|uniref:ShlB/FhaC/HecB family hemolysin secretion/activation protein n=1 Tax=unclassified Mesorhizobium TaxID=325217 RepID=UPI001FDFBFC5|nr:MULTISPECIES: ShlB/FhaC/HecB family hemolysin secretion/activation protein [unclassified Mesorhizobium]